MSDQTPAAPVSPTGQPLVPPRLVPYGLALLAAIGAVALSAPELGLGDRVQRILELVALVLGTVLGVASPGLRRAAKPLAVLALVVGLSGCAHGSAGAAFASKTFDCAAPLVAAQAQQAVPAVLDALAGGTNGWADALDRLVLSFGDVAVCAVKVAVAELTARPQAPVNATAAMLAVDRSELQLARARRFLEANGVAP